jgi:hypothetical protein
LILGEERFQATNPRQEKIFGKKRSLAGNILAREDPRQGKITCRQEKIFCKERSLAREDPDKIRFYESKDLWQEKILSLGKNFG